MSSSDSAPSLVSFPAALSSPEDWLEPFDWYREMREEDPVRYDDGRGCWDVFRYDDVKHALGTPETFSSDPTRASGFDGETNPFNQSMINSDGDRHDRLRGVVAEQFRPDSVAELEPRIREVAGDLLDDVAADGRMDLVDDFAYPLPVVVIAELLGVPKEDRDQFREWSNTLIETPVETDPEAAREQVAGEETIQELAMYFVDLVEQRRADPRADLLSEVVHAEVDGEPLSREEVLGLCMLLLVAGNITTTNLLGNAVRCFGEHPHLFDDLAGDEAALQSAIEEVLRYRSPVQAFDRVVTEDVELGGEHLGAGEEVVVWLGSADRDPGQFEAPDEFRPDRSPNQHLGFGYGTHYCLGAPLARLEATVALSTLLSRFEGLEVVDTDLSPVRSSFVYGVEHLPVTFAAE